MVSPYGSQGKNMTNEAGNTNNAGPISTGVDLDTSGNLLIDASHPRAIPIRSFNPLTGEFKHYMLRVTSKGGLCLV